MGVVVLHVRTFFPREGDVYTFEMAFICVYFFIFSLLFLVYHQGVPSLLYPTINMSICNAKTLGN